MRSRIFETVARAVFPAALVVSLSLLVRGHDHPGGGFVAGLVMAATIVLQAMAFGAGPTRQSYTAILRPGLWIGLAIAAGFILPVIRGDPALSHYHGTVDLPVLGRLSMTTALLFDIGIFLVVVGATATVIALFVEPTGAEVTR